MKKPSFFESLFSSLFNWNSQYDSSKTREQRLKELGYDPAKIIHYKHNGAGWQNLSHPKEGVSSIEFDR